MTVPLAHASIGGVPAGELAQTYGTPLHCIDLDVLDLEIELLAGAFGKRGVAVGYAAKAFLCVALAELLSATPLRLDVCSLGELLTAESGGFPAGRLYLHGCGKTDEELDAVVAGRVAFDVVDNVEELERLAARVPAGSGVDIMLRLNTGIDAHTHEYVRTSGENTKFGIPLPDVHALFAHLAQLPQLRLIGLHGHVGSNILDVAPLVANVDVLRAAADRARAFGHPVRELLAGGGFGVETIPGQPRPLAYDDFAAALTVRIADSPYTLGVEPGRAVIARAGTSLYRVMAVKRVGGRQFVIVDGGMADNPRPALYDAYHHVEVVQSAAAALPVRATLCGRSCENDELGDVDLPADVRAGDLLAVHTTGAYTYSMASNYNRFGRPPVVFVRDGSHRRVVRGERPDDVLRNDVR